MNVCNLIFETSVLIAQLSYASNVSDLEAVLSFGHVSGGVNHVSKNKQM